MSETPAKYQCTKPLKHLNIRLPERTHRELKAKCALEGFTLAKAIEELIRAFLAGKVEIIRETEYSWPFPPQRYFF